MLSHKPTLNAALARSALDAALRAASTNGLTMSVAVVDDGGYPLCLERMDGAGLLTAKVASEKARTSALLRAPSRALADRVAADPALLRLTDYLPMTGGLPIMAEGRCIGAIGVSGGTPEQDEKTGQAGIGALHLD
tara:strand:- start:26345 stop:26752 length:408 start_codon:yes stop_codon:yes gene_type:complete